MEAGIPIDKDPEEEAKEAEDSKENKKKLSKKAKIAIIISAVVIVLLGVAAALYFLVFKKEEPEIVLTDRDILISNSWEKKDAPTVIWTFHEDGTGEVTTNKSNYYDTTWTLEDSETGKILNITNTWLYELKDSFTFSLDKETNSFTVKNMSDETESTFVPLGTAEKAANDPTGPTEEVVELEKTEE